MWDWHCGVCTGPTVGSVGSSWETFEGRKGIIAHALEEYLSFMSEGLEQSRQRRAGSSLWWQGINKDDDALCCYILSHFTDWEVCQAVY